MGYKKQEKLSPLDEWTNFKNNIQKSDDFHSKELLRMTEEWIMYTTPQKAQAYRDWDAYYAKCAQSPIAKLFWSMKEKLSARNLMGVREVRAEVQKLKEGNRIPKPTCIDPYLIRNNQTCSTYLRLTFAAKASQDAKERGIV